MSSRPQPAPLHLKLFVYGTLKRGGRYHHRFCRGVLSVEEATVRGRLHTLPAGYPILEVPNASMLAEGTADPLTDVATQARLAANRAPAGGKGLRRRNGVRQLFERRMNMVGSATEKLSDPVSPHPLPPAGARSQLIAGEILTFDDPGERLLILDELEDFHPGASSLYRRVLLAVQPKRGGSPILAWTYVAPERPPLNG